MRKKYRLKVWYEIAGEEHWVGVDLPGEFGPLTPESFARRAMEEGGVWGKPNPGDYTSGRWKDNVTLFIPWAAVLIIEAYEVPTVNQENKVQAMPTAV